VIEVAPPDAALPDAALPAPAPPAPALPDDGSETQLPSASGMHF
jgi:hypothetical protein